MTPWESGKDDKGAQRVIAGEAERGLSEQHGGQKRRRGKDES